MLVCFLIAILLVVSDVTKDVDDDDDSSLVLVLEGIVMVEGPCAWPVQKKFSQSALLNACAELFLTKTKLIVTDKQ